MENDLLRGMPMVMGTFEETLPLRRSTCEIGDLIRLVDRQTQRQVENLSIHALDDRLVVTGRSPTYYVKQLVTQAILESAPATRLVNEIFVA